MIFNTPPLLVVGFALVPKQAQLKGEMGLTGVLTVSEILHLTASNSGSKKDKSFTSLLRACTCP